MFDGKMIHSGFDFKQFKLAERDKGGKNRIALSPNGFGRRFS